MPANNNINERFENFISSLSIPRHFRLNISRAILKVVKNLPTTKNQIIFPIQNSNKKLRNVIKLQGHEFGGSFDRGTNIRNISDVDAYVLYDELPTMERLSIALQKLESDTHIDYRGEVLLKTLNNQLKKARLSVRRKLEIKHPPYTHAIKVKMRYANQVIKMDLVPAIDLHEGGNLLIPYTTKNTMKVNPTKEENALKKINKRTDGRGTKMIRLVKAWNNHSKRPFISYILERLVLEVFKNKPVDNWDKALITFFTDANKLINQRTFMADKVYSHISILKSFTQERLTIMQTKIEQAKIQAQNTEWEKLFGKGKI